MPTYPVPLPTGDCDGAYVNIPLATATRPGLITAEDQDALNNLFSLRTTTVDGVGEAVFTPLGKSTLRTSWTILLSAASITLSGGVAYRGSSAQLVIVSDGAGVASLEDTSNVGSSVTFGFSGDAGKIVVSVAIVAGVVRLVFTPVGENGLRIAYAVSGSVTSAVGA